MTPGAEPISDSVAEGRKALERGAWQEARERFAAASQSEDSGEAWEGLGWAGYWLHDAETTLGARERAFQAYRASDDVRGAGRVAAWLAADFLEFRGDHAVAGGWLERAHRLLDGVPAGADHGWLAVIEGSFELRAGELAKVMRSARRATRLGRECGVPDLEAIGLSLEGFALVGQARVRDGVRRLDEAAAIATGEHLQLPISVGWALCYLIAACEGVGDFPRATQWCRVMRASAERSGARHSRGVCRSSYGAVLACGGDFDAAETELTGALGDLEAARPGMVGGGIVRLGELRERQGRLEEARELFERAGTHRLAVLGLGRLALDGGDPNAAADAAERVLRRLPADSVLDRIPALELLVRARAALGDVDEAAAAFADLRRGVEAIGTPYLEGRAHLAHARLALARDAHEEARRACEDALDRFGEAGAPYDAALARLGLARSLAALGRGPAAQAEARTAREAFAAIGAIHDAARADAVLSGAADGEVPGDLTPRELEVLRLVAQGLTSAEIAERLFLSPHTVHRHIANARAKLRMPSRAAAVAYAARVGLL
jgi:DNA-binding CsgD family transcriptional regulator/tetratricopeptide (TPR) repeat protein